MSWWRKLLKTISTGGPWMLPVAYLTCFTVVWGFLWALEEPLGISGGVHLGTVSLPGHVLHLLLAFLVAPHLALIAYHRAMHTSERLRDAESELRLAHAEREH
ncbi:MAG TPA: hypothetical protein PK413_02255, partial [Thermoanaerobaculia bacterium]|nr:hypothetical protein [Thermoanaerobaculia bacterium]